jgi:serine/threonine-protein kinase
VPDVAESTVVDGRYRVVERVGSGGMAEVWCAEDLQLGRKVALKLLHRRFAEDGEFVERFRREASSAAGLQHPNVVSVYDRGEWDGTSYIAMEYVDGEPLKAVVQREGPLDPDRAIDLTAQVLRAARFAHRRGIVHRDLKPHNVIVDGEGRAKVADFGIARAGASDMTETGAIMGTAQYLSPEQAQGHAVSARSDLYAIGVTLFELLTGRVPFDGESAVTIALKHVAEEPVPPSRLNPAVPHALDAVVLRALAKDPDHRFEDADAFIAALEAARAGALPPGTGVDGAGHPGPPTASFAPVVLDGAVVLPEAPAAPRRRSLWPWVLAAALVAAAVVATVLLVGRTERRQVPEVVGANVAEAGRRLRDEGFRPVFDRVRSDEPADRVIEQDPRPSTELEVGAEVRLTVSDGPGEAGVPDVLGLSGASARRRLERAGFRVRTRRVASADVEAGNVVRTSPPGGTRITRGSRVTLVVSRGPEQVAVPDLSGRSLGAAQQALGALGLTANVERRESADAEADTVLDQTPGAGATVAAGTAVTLVVAAAVEQVDVPDVVGRTESEASERLSAAGFAVDVRTRDAGPDEDGEVLAQSVTGRAERGATVTVTVGRFDDSDLDPDPDAPDDGGTGGTGGTGAEPEPDAPADDGGTGGTDGGAAGGAAGAEGAAPAGDGAGVQ